MPEPFAYNPLGTPFIELPSVDSTNNYALTQLHAGLAQHGAAFFAHEQIAGKGRRGKTWASDKDANLILSIVINPGNLELSQQFQLSACIAVSAAEFFSQYAGDATRIKWPNDLYWYDRKAGGILIENVIGSRKPEVRSEDPNIQETAAWLWAVAGIGININQASFPEELKNPVSLRQITGKHFDPVELGKELCFMLEKNFKQLILNGFENIYTTYLSLLYKKNEPARLKKDNRVFEAIIRSVLPTGELVVEHGVEERFKFDEIEWVITADQNQK